jgi:pimeloyl-ACP methyl ester carboxylesterase
LHIDRPADIVGASMGGGIVTAFVAAQPSRIRSVVLIAPSGGGHQETGYAALSRPIVGDWIFRLLGSTLTSRMMENAYPPSPERDALVAWMHEQGRFRGFSEGLLNNLRNYDAAWQPDAYRALGRTNLPVLAVWGTADTVNPIAQSRQIAAWVPQLTVAPLAGKPHAITFADAPIVLAKVLPFLARVDPKRAPLH